MKIGNTWFRKRLFKQVTFRPPGTKIGEDEWIPGKYEQIDFNLHGERWKHTVNNIESDTNANIDTDHFPVKARVKRKLRA